MFTPEAASVTMTSSIVFIITTISETVPTTMVASIIFIITTISMAVVATAPAAQDGMCYPEVHLAPQVLSATVFY
jgi:hypothetical protein